MTSSKDKGENNNINRLNALNGNASNGLVRTHKEPSLFGLDFEKELGDPLEDPNLSPRDALALLKHRAMHVNSDITQLKHILTRSVKLQSDAIKQATERIDTIVERIDTADKRSKNQSKELKNLSSELEQLRADLDVVASTADIHTGQLELIVKAIDTNTSEIQKMTKKRFTLTHVLLGVLVLIFGIQMLIEGKALKTASDNRHNIEAITNHINGVAP